MENFLQHIWKAPRNVLVFCLLAYQSTLSPDHGPLRHLYPYGYCRHEPTCSQYGKKVIIERGAIIGSLLLIKRLLTCHPWKKVSDAKVRKVLGVD